MSKHSRRQTPASRDNRRATIHAKRAETDELEPSYILGVGHVVAISDTPRKRKKHPLGFSA